MNLIENDIALYKSEGSLCLIGDMNARTKCELDYIRNDDTEYGVELDEYYDIDVMKRGRFSQDKGEICKRGNQLLEMCKASRMRILNGRCIGDSQGLYTCHRPNGSSVVDYVLCSEEKVRDIAYFQVHEYNGELSDHCCISFAQRCVVKVSFKVDTSRYDTPVSYKWNMEAYQGAFTAEVIMTKIECFVQEKFNCNNCGIDKMVEKLTDIYKTAASISLKKKSNTRTKSKKTKHKPWFNETLANKKRVVLHLSALLQKFPKDPFIRGAFFKNLKHYNKSRKRQARKFKEGMLRKLDELRDSKPQEYWKLLKKLKDTKDDSNDISLEEFRQYFKNLNEQSGLEPRQKQNISKLLAEMEKEHHFDEMDFEITEKEVRDSLKLLKNKKAIGLDQISNEMLKYTQHKMISLLTKTFNTILISRKYPTRWCEGFIHPIFKAGNIESPENYRGITILSCLAKLFNNIINRRIEEFLTKHGLIDQRQIGFKKEARTSDHMFILRSLIEKYTKKGKNLYTCFIDFKKAFDLLDHTALLYKLNRIGIKGNIYYLLKDMYMAKKIRLRVRTKDKFSNEFTSVVGVSQGDPVSPNLFKIFINDMFENTSENEAPTLKNVNIKFLLYADDVVVLANSPENLQKYMDEVETYTKRWGLTVNTNKTKVVIFNSKGKLINLKIMYGKTELESVMSYKYLGLHFHVSGKFEIARKDLLDRGMKAMFKLTSMFKVCQPSYNTCMHLFDCIVKPVLIYAADICGYKISRCKSLYNELKNDVFEKCHLRFIRFTIGVNRKAPKLGLYGESGRVPLLCSAAVSYLKYWHRMVNMKEGTLLSNAYDHNSKNVTPWFKGVKRLLELINVPIELATKINCSTLVKMLVCKCKIDFIEGWKSELFDDKRKQHGNKLRMYRMFKDYFEVEPYLQTCINQKHRMSLSRLRLSCHKLQIEIQRYSKTYIEPEKRICKMCNLDMCEDELHFLIQCPKYEDERSSLLKCVYDVSPNVEGLDAKGKFIYIMSAPNIKIIKALGMYVYKCFQLRNDKSQDLITV